MSTTPAALKMSRRMSRLFPWFSALVLWLGRIGTTPLKVDYSHAREVEFTIAMLPAKGDTTKPDYFIMIVKKVGSGRHARWLVDQWVPRDAPPIPANPVG